MSVSGSADADMKQVMRFIRQGVPRTVKIFAGSPSRNTDLHDLLAELTGLTRARVFSAVKLSSLEGLVATRYSGPALIGVCRTGDEELMEANLRPRLGHGESGRGVKQPASRRLTAKPAQPASLDETIRQLKRAIAVLVEASTDGWGHNYALGTLNRELEPELGKIRVNNLFTILRGLATEDGRRVLELPPEIPRRRFYRITPPSSITQEMIAPARLGRRRFRAQEGQTPTQ